jgi:GNAT superfamily N-acetyltransferase
MTHTRVVLALLVQSTLAYGEDADRDMRLAAWERCEGRWAVAVTDQGLPQGIIACVPLDDIGRDGLLWLEVLPYYQRQGVGRTLVQWAQERATAPLLVRSVSSAAEFYQRCGLTVAVAA